MTYRKSNIHSKKLLQGPKQANKNSTRDEVRTHREFKIADIWRNLDTNPKNRTQETAREGGSGGIAWGRSWGPRRGSSGGCWCHCRPTERGRSPLPPPTLSSPTSRVSALIARATRTPRISATSLFRDRELLASPGYTQGHGHVWRWREIFFFFCW